MPNEFAEQEGAAPSDITQSVPLSEESLPFEKYAQEIGILAINSINCQMPISELRTAC